MARRIKITIEYDGTHFHGWQVQPYDPLNPRRSSRTVQGEIESGLQRLTGAFIRVQGASRTDAGVHATGQVGHFDWPEGFEIPDERIAPAMNARLPEDVAVIDAETVSPEFHAQHDARGKIYRYRLFCRKARSVMHANTHWQLREPLDLPAMHEAARHLVGAQDLSSFAVELKTIQEQRAKTGLPPLETVRRILRVDVFELGDLNSPHAEKGGMELAVEIEGSGFLYKMVRTMVGSLVEVGRGARAPAWMAEVVAARDRAKAGPTAPAKGLCLMRVLYG